MDDQELNQHLQALARRQARAPDYLAGRILAQVPERNALDRLTQWFGAAPWRGAMAAALPLLAGFVLGTVVNNAAVDDASAWYAAEELVYGRSYEEYEYDEI